MAGPPLLAQQTHPVETVRFVYGGDEDKPHGTLVISVGEYVKPKDRGSLDDYFGKCVVTDKKTLELVRQFIQQSKYLTQDNGRIGDSVRQWIQSGYPYYEIIGSDGSAVFLNGKYRISFFNELKMMLRAHDVDEKVIAAL